MRNLLAFKLLIIFAVAGSLSSLPGPLASYHVTPSINLARANPAPAQAWTPAGPSMDTEKVNIYTSTPSMLTGLSTGEIDLTDGPASANYISCVQNAVPAACAAIGITNPAAFYITAPNIPGSQYVYTSNFNNGVINGASAGIPNFFTWLNAYTNTPAASGALLQNCPGAPVIIGPDCFRQGFSSNTVSLNPFDAGTFDLNIVGNIYDSLMQVNALSSNQVYAYLTIGFPLTLANSALGYTPAAGTVTSLRFTLRPDAFFQNGQKVTSWDVKFSYLELKATAAFQSIAFAPVLQDVHVLSPTTFDLNLNNLAFSLPGVTSPTIMPGSLWTASGSAAWNAAEAACSGPGVVNPETCFTGTDPTAYSVTAAQASLAYDPLASGTLVGSGAWECLNPTTGVVGGGCSNTGTENPNLNYQLTRFGAGTTPALASPSSKYFRSSGTMASYIWAGNNGGTTHDFLNLSTVASCFNKAAGTAGCTQWQMGIGNPTGYNSGTPATTLKKVLFSQVNAVLTFYQVHWSAPFDYLPGIFYASAPPFTANPPAGAAALPLTLYEGTSTGNQFFNSGTEQVLQPASAIGCTTVPTVGTQGANGYDC